MRPCQGGTSPTWSPPSPSSCASWSSRSATRRARPSTRKYVQNRRCLPKKYESFRAAPAPGRGPQPGGPRGPAGRAAHRRGPEPRRPHRRRGRPNPPGRAQRYIACSLPQVLRVFSAVSSAEIARFLAKTVRGTAILLFTLRHARALSAAGNVFKTRTFSVQLQNRNSLGITETKTKPNYCSLWVNDKILGSEYRKLI